MSWAAPMAVAAALAQGPLAPATPNQALQPYFEGAIVCELMADPRRICRLWLNPNGDYQIFYDLGPLAQKPKGARGPFELEGREGRYEVRDRLNGDQDLCLTPAPAQGWRYAMAFQKLLFGGAGCTPFKIRRPGEHWSAADPQGRGYTLWLIEGR